MNDNYQAGDSTVYAGMAQICQLKCIVRKHKISYAKHIRISLYLSVFLYDNVVIDL